MGLAQVEVALHQVSTESILQQMSELVGTKLQLVRT